MKFLARVAPGELTRLDAEYYEPAALVIDSLVRSRRHKLLGECIHEGYRVVYHGVDEVGDEASIPFLAPSDIDENGDYNIDQIATVVPIGYLNQYPKGLAIANEILIEVKGNTAKVALVKVEDANALMVSGSLYKARVIAGTDPRFIASYLSSKHGSRLKRRVISNVNISYIGKDDLYNLPVPDPSSDAQHYIGSKVHLAECLRGWAQSLLREIKDSFRAIHSYSSSRLLGSWRQAGASLNEERLDANFYAPPALKLINSLATEGGFQIASVVKLVNHTGFDHTRPISYFEIGGIDIVTGCAWPDTVGPGEAPSRARNIIRPWDILVSTVRPERKNVGIVPPSSAGQLVATTGFAVLRAATPQAASFLWGFLRSDAATEQLMRWNTGATYPAIDEDDTLQVFMPLISEDKMHRIGERWMQIPVLLVNAKSLVNCARLLVEALIEGKITEAELIAAGKDADADRALLARLRDDGLDGAGTRLFPDIDALFELIEQVQGTEADS